MTANARLVLSAVFLLLGILVLKATPPRRAYAIAVLPIAVLTALLFAAHFAADYFTAEGINEAVIYHLKYGLQGAGFAEYAALAGIATMAVLLLVAGLLWFLRTRTATRRRIFGARGNEASLLCVCLAGVIHPAGAAVYELLPGRSTEQVGDDRSFDSMGDPALRAEFSSYYAQPKAAPAGAPTRNLVFIYAESLERTYFDETLFPGLITDLRTLEREAVSFTEIEDVPGTRWTIAGMVASQCGIPLFAPSNGNSMSGMDAFLPGATCLGDLLKSSGYRLVFYGGASTKFAGKGKFYASHGFDEVMGRRELLAGVREPDYVSSWGLFDDSLLELAFDKYSELARSAGRFGLFVLTLDTHHPDGHPSRRCQGMTYGDGKNPILNAVRCTDHLLAEFIARTRASPTAADPVIVVASDHLALRNSARDLLEQRPRRYLFMVLDSREPRGALVPTPGSALDISPTLMPFLGFDAQLGLGRNLMIPDARLDARATYVRSRLKAWSEPLSGFWGFPRIEQYLEVDADDRVVRIDGRSFSLPALVELDGRMQTVIRFPHGTSSAMELLREGGSGKPFVLVAECSARDSRLPPDRTCIFAGHGKQVRVQLIVDDKARFSPGEIMSMTGSSP